MIGYFGLLALIVIAFAIFYVNAGGCDESGSNRIHGRAVEGSGS